MSALVPQSRIALAASLLLTALSPGQVVITEFLTANDTVAVPNAEAGRFDDWIELTNKGDTARDLSGWHLTDDAAEPRAWTFPGGSILPANETLIIFASGDGVPDSKGNLHADFRLASSGEHLALVRPDGTIASEFGPNGTPFPPQRTDISYGLHPETSEVVFFDTPTPGETNDPGGIARVAGLEVSPRRGLYQTAQSVTLFTPTPGATIFYTTDGTPPLTSSGNPTSTASPYTGPIALVRTTVLRASARAPGLSPSREQAHTYLLLDIDNATANGSDPAGLNTFLIQQNQPVGWENLTSGDYNMDPVIARNRSPSVGHDGLTVAQAMLEGMREAPTISISMPPQDFTQIYRNSNNQDIDYENLCSAEFIPGENDSRADFQEFCGLRAQGGASRNPSASPKHSLSFRFREEYGAGRLRQVLFPDVEVANFNSIALRAGYNNSWIHRESVQRARGSMIRDQWMRESIRDMGNEDAGAGFLAHVYINGLYWGLHNVCERQDNAHYANYNGGDSDLIDARNSSNFVEGNATAWNKMREVVTTRNWDDIQQVIDVDNYIDFQIIQRFAANRDLREGNNWRAAGGGPFTDPTDMRPWKLYSWDSERTLEEVNETFVPVDPMAIRGTLEGMPEYRQRFADRAYQHLTGDGAITPDNCRARWEKYASAIDKAIIAESARWGDHRESTPYDRDDWLREQNRLYNNYFTVRTTNVINALKAANLFPRAEAPVVELNGQVSDGGYVGGGNTLSLTGGEGTIYYTTDGSDPRLPDGSINPDAAAATPGGIPESVFTFESDGWRYLSDGVAQSGSDVVAGNASYDPNDWKHPDFNDHSWPTGRGLLAGSTSTAIRGRTARTVFSLTSPNGKIAAAYFRKAFEISNASSASTIDLSIVRDDGVIVYLNGREIYRNKMAAGTVNYGDLAAGISNESEVLEFSVPLTPGVLLEGTNVLAVEVHNYDIDSNDLGLDVAATVSRANLVLTDSARLTARARSGSNWSAPVSGVFLVEEPARPSQLVISEINYHPREVTLREFLETLPLDYSDSDQFEFLELRNVGNSPLNLAGCSFSDGISFTFGLRVLAPGEHVLLVRNQDAFLSRYGEAAAERIIGTFSGALDNDGETLTLLGFDGSVVTSFTYNDAGAWPSRPDGGGSTLELAHSTGPPNDPANWISSTSYDGSPGTVPPFSNPGIVINEVSSHSDADFIELYNTTDSPVDLNGWLLSDDKSVYRSFSLPDITLGAFEYLVIPATDYDAGASAPITNYGGTPGGPSTVVSTSNHGLSNGDLVTISGYGGLGNYNQSFEILVVNADTFAFRFPYFDNHPVKGFWEKGRSFGLSANNGDDLWLLETDPAGDPVSFGDHVEFAAAAPETTLGRWPDGAGEDTLVTMTSKTSGAPNTGPVLGPVILSEVHHAPANSDSHEFVEITNTGNTTISLDQWRLRGGLDFNFTSTHSLAAGESLVVVPFDPITESALAASFRSHFGISLLVDLLGPATDGPLNDDKGTVRLQQAGPAPDLAQITVDEVRYSAETPWPIATNGPSLNRRPVLAFGNFSSSWDSAAPTPGIFALEPREDYATWAIVNSVGDGSLDADGDALSNLLEFVMGTDPNIPTRLDPAVFDGETATISFPSHLNRGGVTLTFETSPDLEAWTARQTTAGPSEGPIQTRLYSVNLSDHPTIFWRLTARSQDD